MGAVLSRMRIGYQIAVLGLIGVLGLLAVAGVNEWGSIRLARNDANAEAMRRIATLESKAQFELLQARRHEKDFLLRLDEKSVSLQQAATSDALRDLNEIANRVAGQPEYAELARGMIADVNAYAVQFAAVVGRARAIGLNENEGLLGALRTAVHEVETRLDAVPVPEARIAMLMMRRHEKDFIARLDPRYGVELKARLKDFDAAIDAAGLPAELRRDLGTKMAAYQDGFAQFMAAMLERAGAVARLSAAYAEIEPRLAAANQRFVGQVETAARKSTSLRTTTSRLTALSMALLTAAVIALSWLIGHNIVRPIAGMTDTMRRLADHDMNVEIAGTERGDEIGAMAAAVLVFKESMRTADVIEARRAAERAERERRLAAMERHTGEFRVSIADVMTALVESGKAMREASETMAKAARTVTVEARETAEGAAKSSQDLSTVATAVEELTAVVAEISRQVAASGEVARHAVRRTEISQTTMRSLSEAATRIGDVVSVISDIAGQTNLLALNATIEAARAGEAGRGFAVVAGEVKALAAQTARATAEIGGQIGTVRGAAEGAVAAMSEISAIIREIDEVSATIFTAVEQQSAATREIASSVLAVSGATAQTALTMEHVVKVASDSGAASQEVLSGSTEIGREADTLRDKVDRFLQAIQIESGARHG